MIHTVFFWLKSDLTAEQKETFESELKRLPLIPYVKEGYAGTPAETENRPSVTDHSFSYSLILEFANMEDHDRYQNDDADHDRFVDTCKELWEKVIVYDSETLS